MDIQQTTTGDIAIVNNTIHFFTGADEVGQRITQRLRTFLGEWFLNQNIGVPYFQEILKKNPNNRIVEAVFKREIIDTPGVIGLESFEILADNATRVITLRIRCKTESGDVQTEVTI